MGSVIGYTLLGALGIATVAGGIIGSGWILFLVYNATVPESWVYLDLWPAVGIMLLVSIILAGTRAGAK